MICRVLLSLMICLALSGCGSQRKIEKLTAQLGNENVEKRYAATLELSEMEPQPETISALMIAIQDENRHVYRKAMDGLASIGSPAVPPLIRSIEKERVTDTLVRIGEPTVPRLVATLAEEEVGPRQAAIAALARIGEPAVPHLIAALSSTDYKVRRGAVIALGYIKEPNSELVPALIKALRDTDYGVREAAAIALGHIAQPADQLVLPLTKALQDPDPTVRQQAAIALGRIGAPAEEAVPALIIGLRDSDTEIAAEMVTALWQIGAPAVPTLIQELGSSESVIHGKAGKVLVLIGLPAVQMLAQSLSLGGTQESDDGGKREDSRVPDRAALVLGQIGAAAEPAVPELIKALDGTGWRLRENAAFALGRIGDASAIPALVRALKDDDRGVRACASTALVEMSGQAVPALAESLVDADVAVRWRAAQVLEKIGGPASNAVSSLIQALQDEHPWVRDSAARALQAIGTLEATDALEEYGTIRVRMGLVED